MAKMQAAREAADAARRAEAEAGAAIREAGREEDAAAVEMERLELRRTGLGERAALAAADLADAERALAEAESVAAALARRRRDRGRRSPSFAPPPSAPRRRWPKSAPRRRPMPARSAPTSSAPRRPARSRPTGAPAPPRPRRATPTFGRRIAEAEAEAQRLAEAPAALDRRDRGADRRSRPPPPKPRRPPPRMSAPARRRCSETEARLAEAGEAQAAAREARAGAAARAEAQDARREEMARISGEQVRMPAAAAARDGRLQGGGDRAGRRRNRRGSSARSQERERIGPVNLVAESELNELEESRLASPGRARGAGPGDPPPARLDRQPEPRGPRPAARRLPGRSTAISAACSPPCSRAARPISSWSNRTIRSRPGSRSWRSRRASASPTLTLLSGGEQALTAIALIFALFLTNPAPICVLDEVDAPLDDANIERFCDLLDRMTGETDTRYLIVTHNAVTMSRMHRLFGVTMIEKGVSRLVSVDLGGAERLLAAE